MRIFIHGIKSIIRRPAKTTMLFLILFVIFNLIFIGFIIDNSISESKEYIRNQMGSAVEYKMDFESLLSGENRQQMQMQSIPALSKQVADKMAQSVYVSQYFLSESGNVNSDTISPAETQQSAGGFQRSFSDFSLKGSNVTVPIDFVMENIALKEGNLFSAANIDNGDNVILISEAIANANNLRVNDTVSLSLASNNFGGPGNANNQTTTTTTAESQSFVVIGTFEVRSEDFDVNTILTSNAVIETLNNNVGSDDTNASIVYLLNNPEHVNAFIEENTPYLTSEYHSLYSNDDDYVSLTKPLDLITVITALFCGVVFAAGSAIILAIVTIFVRDRKFEIGLLLASGEGRMKIVTQFVLEIMVIAIIAFTFSVGTSNIAAKYIGDWIVETQLLSDDSVVNTSTTTDTNIMRIGMNAGQSSVYGDVNMQNVADAFDASVSVQVIWKLLGASMLLVFIGSGVPLVVIMGYNPRRILQDN